MLFVLISILAGVSIVVSRIINSNLAKEIGIFQGTVINYITGLFCSFIFLLFSGELSRISAIKLGSLPPWAYLGSLAGVLVVVLSSFLTPRMSAFYLTLLVFVGQLFAGTLIDYFALGNLSTGKVAGGLLVLLGLSYNLILDKKQVVQASAAAE